MTAFAPQLTRNGFIGAKIQTDPEAAIALVAGSCGFRVKNPRFKPVGDSIVIANPTGLGDMIAIPGAYSGEIGFDLELYGTPSTGAPTAKWPAILFPACGFAQTGTSPNIFSFSSDTTTWKALTIANFYGTGASDQVDGIYSAMGMISAINLPVGAQATASFSFKGCLDPSPSSGSAVSGFTFEESRPPVFAKAGALTIGGQTVVPVDNVQVTFSDYVILIQAPTSPGGFLRAYLKKPDIRVKCSPLSQAAAKKLTDWLGATTTTISAVLDGGAGNKFTIYTGTNKAQLVTAPGNGERDELRTDDLEFIVLNHDINIKME